MARVRLREHWNGHVPGTEIELEAGRAEALERRGVLVYVSQNDVDQGAKPLDPGKPDPKGTGNPQRMSPENLARLAQEHGYVILKSEDHERLKAEAALTSQGIVGNSQAVLTDAKSPSDLPAQERVLDGERAPAGEKPIVATEEAKEGAEAALTEPKVVSTAEVPEKGRLTAAETAKASAAQAKAKDGFEKGG